MGKTFLPNLKNTSSTCSFLKIYISISFFTQIKESEWLNGVDWPEPDHQYRSLPLRVPFESTELTEAEAKTRELIKDIGIDGNLLESHIERGPRSHIIGTFRIAQHK